MNAIATLLSRVQAAHDDALEAAPHPSSKPFREAKQAVKKRFAELATAVQALGSGWIPVDSRLPDDDMLVLIALNDDDVWTGFREAGVWRYVDAMPINAERVTHWQPMPAPPVRNAA